MSHHLGQEKPKTVDVVLEELYKQARVLFPKETAKAESWVTQRATLLGISRAKEIGAQAVANPLTWLAVGGLVAFLFSQFRK